MQILAWGAGGSSYSVAGGTQAAGAGTTPGNSAHVLRSGAGNGGAAVGTNTAGVAGTNGVVILYLFY